MTALAQLTTMRVGGTARELLQPATVDELVEATLDVWDSGEDWLVLGGGSNVVVSDEGFDGSVIRVTTRGIDLVDGAPEGSQRLLVQAGEPWDDLVAFTVANGLAGIEALSGIPGSSGAAPVQNIGAYGQEISQTLVAVDFVDYLSGERERLSAADLDLDYRTSALKQGKRGLVVAIELDLVRGGDAVVRYPQLASSLGVAVGDSLPLDTVRSAVLALRSSKGMLLSPQDPDSVSCGSFFTNPIVGENFARTLPEATPRWPNAPEPEAVAVPIGEEPAPPPQQTDFRVKLSAAWLIERAGVHRGFSLPGSRAAISSKHTLAIVNTGGATAADVTELARYVQTRVFSEFGVRMLPEPVLVGTTL